MRLWFLIAMLGGGLLVAMMLGDEGTIGGLDSSRFVAFACGAALLAFVGIGALNGYGGQLGKALRDIVTWCALTLVLVLGYSYRDEFQSIAQRVTGELLPPGDGVAVTTTNAGERAVRIRRRSDGHFVARTSVDRANIVMLVDTGASTVVLKTTDARAAGINVDGLTYSVPVKTANGTAYAAAVRINRMMIGGIAINGVDALVAKPGMLNESLLGMSFLRRLRSYEFSGDFLTLRS